jgi:hypothetical protein
MREINRIVWLSSIADKATDKHEPFEINFKYNVLIDCKERKHNRKPTDPVLVSPIKTFTIGVLYLEFHLGQYTLQIHIDKINSITKHFHDNVRRLHYSHCST